MKLLSMLTAGLLSLAVIQAKAQEPTVPAPEFKNKVMFVKKDNTLESLDNTDLSTDLKSKITGSDVFLKAMGTTASVSHSGSPKNRFIVKLDTDTDPESAVELMQFTADKTARRILVNAMASTGKAKDITLPKFKLNFTKLADGVYLITPQEQLPDGEYVFIINRPSISVLGAAGGSQSMKGFCFFVAQQG
jgi:hypothetical protein